MADRSRAPSIRIRRLLLRLPAGDESRAPELVAAFRQSLAGSPQTDANTWSQSGARAATNLLSRIGRGAHGQR